MAIRSRFYDCYFTHATPLSKNVLMLIGAWHRFLTLYRRWNNRIVFVSLWFHGIYWVWVLHLVKYGDFPSFHKPRFFFALRAVLRIYHMASTWAHQSLKLNGHKWKKARAVLKLALRLKWGNYGFLQNSPIKSLNQRKSHGFYHSAVNVVRIP